ncbi:MAG: DNA internalization-related competence protein ComEC/Rec2 [Desulfuromonadales bacterium]|nr:DNA internalization-related competence protein ComEC/Rec2 [Desulfuromonadales bacterium]
MQPVSVCLVAYAAGLLWGGFLRPGVPHALFWSLPFFTALCWYLCRNMQIAALICLSLTLLLIGLLRVPFHLYPAEDSSRIHTYSGPSPVVVEGEVLRVTARGPGKSSVDVAAQLVSSQGIATRVAGPVRLYLDNGYPELLYGDRIRFRSRLRRLRMFGTPGEFDQPRHLAYSGIRVTAYLSDAGSIVKLGAAAASPMRRLARWKLQCGRMIDRSVPEGPAALVRALTLGDRGSISGDQRRLLARTGVAHLFAISGLHMGLLALFGYQALLWGYRRFPGLLRWQPPQRVLPLLLLPLLLAYLALTGDALSTRRAFALCCCAAVLLAWRRRVAPMQLLTSVAFLFLLLEPLALWQASFQLSFAGVAGILCWKRYWLLPTVKLPGIFKKFLQIVLITLAANLATMPLVLLNFHLLSLAGLVNNLFAIPMVTLLAVPAGLAGLLLTNCSQFLAETGFVLCGKVLELTLKCAESVAEIPALDAAHLFLSPAQLIGITGCALTLLLPWKRVVVPCLLLICLGGWAYADLTVRGVDLALTAFSVGQGESMLLTLKGGRHLLVDGGGLHSDSFDVGERLLAPALGQLGVKQLEAILLTHDHPDHRKGLIYILDHFPVKEFWWPLDGKLLNDDLREALLRHNIPVRRFSRGWTEVVTAAADLELFCYVPDQESVMPNDRSVVLYARHGQDGLLLTGDLERSGTAMLLDGGIPGPVTLLKLPHHGSRNSGSHLLLQTLKPQIALVSAGYRNHYRFPADEVVGEVLELEAELYRTDLHGTVRFVSDGQGWLVKRWENGLFR